MARFTFVYIKDGKLFEIPLDNSCQAGIRFYSGMKWFGGLHEKSIRALLRSSYEYMLAFFKDSV